MSDQATQNRYEARDLLARAANLLADVALDRADGSERYLSSYKDTLLGVVRSIMADREKII